MNDRNCKSSPLAATIPDEVAVFPLPNTILFPGVELPLYIFEPRYRRMLADCLAGTKFLAVSLFKPGWENQKEPIPSYEVAGAGFLKAVVGNPDGTSRILLKGIGRVRIEEYLRLEPYRVARISVIPEQIDDASELVLLAAKLKKLLVQKLRFSSENPREKVRFPKEYENPVWLSYLASFLTEAEPAAKQALLEMPSANERIRRLIRLFQDELCPRPSLN